MDESPYNFNNRHCIFKKGTHEVLYPEDKWADERNEGRWYRLAVLQKIMGLDAEIVCDKRKVPMMKSKTKRPGISGILLIVG